MENTALESDCVPIENPNGGVYNLTVPWSEQKDGLRNLFANAPSCLG